MSSINNSLMNFTTVNTSRTPKNSVGSMHVPANLSPHVAYTFATVLTVLLLLALVGNITLLGLVVSVRKLHSATHIFLANLMVSGLLVATLVMPFDIDKMVYGQVFRHDVVMCELSSTVFFLSLPASALSLCLLTVERFLTLSFPFSRERLMTKKNIVCSLILVWIYVIIMATLPVMGWITHPSVVLRGQCMFFFTIEYAIVMVATNFMLPLLIILALNIDIFCIANRSARRLAVPTQDQNNRRRSTRKGSAISFGANIKAAKRILLLVGLFLLSWLPYIIAVTVNIYCRGCVPREIIWVTTILNYSSAATNPILYGLLNKQVRKEARKVTNQFLGKCLGKDWNKNRNNGLNSYECNTLYTTSTPEPPWGQDEDEKV